MPYAFWNCVLFSVEIFLPSKKNNVLKRYIKVENPVNVNVGPKFYPFFIIFA